MNEHEELLSQVRKDFEARKRDMGNAGTREEEASLAAEESNLSDMIKMARQDRERKVFRLRELIGRPDAKFEFNIKTADELAGALSGFAQELRNAIRNLNEKLLPVAGPTSLSEARTKEAEAGL